MKRRNTEIWTSRNPPKKMGRKQTVCSCQEHDHWIGHRREREVLEEDWRLGFLKRRTGSTLVSPYLKIHSVKIGLVERNTLFIPITIRDQSGKNIETPALVDSGAGGKFINQNFACNSKMDIRNLKEPIKLLMSMESEINEERSNNMLILVSLGYKNKIQSSIGEQENSVGRHAFPT